MTELKHGYLTFTVDEVDGRVALVGQYLEDNYIDLSPDDLRWLADVAIPAALSRCA